jgi:hypothetical protein
LQCPCEAYIELYLQDNCCPLVKSTFLHTLHNTPVLRHASMTARTIFSRSLSYRVYSQPNTVFFTRTPARNGAGLRLQRVSADRHVYARHLTVGHTEAVAARAAVAAADVAHVVSCRAVDLASAVEAGVRVAVAHVALVVHSRACAVCTREYKTYVRTHCVVPFGLPKQSRHREPLPPHTSQTS